MNKSVEVKPESTVFERSVLKDGATYSAVDGVEIAVPRAIMVEMLRAKEAYNAFSAQYNKAVRSGALEGTSKRVALEQRLMTLLNDANEAAQQFGEFCVEAIGQKLAEMTDAAPEDAEAEQREQAAANVLEECLETAEDRYQKKLQDQVLDGTLTVAEYDSVAAIPYAQLRREMYEAAVLEAKQDLGAAVSCGQISHADYFTITGEEYTLAVTEPNGEAAEE